jgi:hypothetical protein
MDPLIRFHHSTRRVVFREDAGEKISSRNLEFALSMMQIRKFLLKCRQLRSRCGRFCRGGAV